MTTRYGSLQVLRGVGAMLVVVQHLAMVESRYLAGPAVMPAVAGFAGCGVDLFFVISGFVIVTSARPDFDHPRAVLPFLVRRFVRIYPIYWFYTTIALIVAVMFPQWIHDSYQWPDILASYALWPSEKVPLVSVGWTLIYEVWFYGVIALAIFLVPLASVARFLLLWAALIVLGAAVLPRDAIAPFVVVTTHPLGLEFIAGALVALAWRQVPGWLGLPLLCLGGILGLASMFAATEFFSEFPAGWGRVLAFGIPSAILVLGCAVWEARRVRQAKGLLLVVGDASYSLYLCHFFVVLAVARAARAYLPLTSFDAHVATLVAAFGASLVVALLSYRYIERPMLNLGPILLRHLPAGSPAALRKG